MEIIKNKGKDEFDAIIHGLDEITNEKYELVATLLILSNSINRVLVARPKLKYMNNYLTAYSDHIKECLDSIYKEETIYNKMLYYLKLLKFNEKYVYYEDSYYKDYFKQVIGLIKQNDENRLIKTTVVLNSIYIGLRSGAPSVTVTGDIEATADLLTDDIYEDILRKIPRR